MIIKVTNLKTLVIELKILETPLVPLEKGKQFDTEVQKQLRIMSLKRINTPVVILPIVGIGYKANGISLFYC